MKPDIFPDTSVIIYALKYLFKFRVIYENKQMTLENFLVSSNKVKLILLNRRPQKTAYAKNHNVIKTMFFHFF